MYALRRVSLPAPPTSGLPPPDYNDESSIIRGPDCSLQMPTVIQYDKWANAREDDNESFPEPPDNLCRSQSDSEFPEPPPDYDLLVDDNPNVIPPHKLPNPVLESTEHMRINKEIKFNNKRHVSVLNAKPELQKELDRRKQEKFKKEQMEELQKNKGTFGRKLSQQYAKLAQLEEEEGTKFERQRKKSEFEKIHEKILSKPPLTAAQPHHS